MSEAHSEPIYDEAFLLKTAIFAKKFHHRCLIKFYYEFAVICFWFYFYGFSTDFNHLELTTQKMEFSIKNFSNKETESTGNCEFGHIYWRNP